MIDWVIEPLREPVVARALAELALLSIVSGTLGCWIVLAGTSYGAESLAHSMLPGLVVASVAGIPLVVGGAAGLAVGALLVSVVGRVRRLEADVAVAVVITGLFGLGVLLGLSPGVPAGLNELLFGDLLATGWPQVALTGGAAAGICAALLVLHPSFLAVFFDREGSRAVGRRPGPFELALAVLLALATLVAVQALGNLLVVAMLVGPAATARLLTARVGPMMAVGVAVALGCSVAGLWVSYYGQVAGGAAVTCALCLAFAAALAARLPIGRLRARSAGA
ncbi:MAG: metal ABC transporter permease [Acidobacteria bacterium]|nr:metal ABC transporter permease [Acidobacteriota bacterium]